MPVFQLHQLGDDAVEMDINGKLYTFTMVSLGGRSRMETVLRRVVPNPIDIAKEACSGQPHEVARVLMDKAFHQRSFWPPAIESDEGVDWVMKSFDLQIAMLREMLRLHHPDLSLDEARSVGESIGIETFAALMRFGWTGKRPDDPDPKATDQPAQPIGNE